MKRLLGIILGILNAVDLLTINEENRLKNKIVELTEKRSVTKEKDEITLLKQVRIQHRQEMKQMREDMESS